MADNHLPLADLAALPDAMVVRFLALAAATFTALMTVTLVMV